MHCIALSDKRFLLSSGNNGSKYSLDVLMDIQNKLDDIDLSIIKELQPLFFGLY